ncbi:MAG: hypothetical protein OIF40_04155 [Mangrovicoccus sp.]|nr:hypothetical protein [Mangrovicoccus sp.]
MFEKARQHPCSANDTELVAAFLALRRGVGLLGLSLPILLFAAARVSPKIQMQGSISMFYHTVMGDILVGILAAIGVFLIAYVGHLPQQGDRLSDYWVSTIAGVAAIGVALFSTAPSDCPIRMLPAPPQGVIFHWCGPFGYVHFLCAAVFFACMALFCFFLFPKNAAGEIKRFASYGDVTYTICGAAIVFAMLALGLFLLIRDTSLGRALDARNIVFWLESLGVWAFGIAWLTKGNMLRAMPRFMRRKH